MQSQIVRSMANQEDPNRLVRLPILSYHSVGPKRKGFDEYLNVPAEMLEQHLRWLLRKGYTSIHLADWIAHHRDGTPLPRKPVVLTFDDAYRDTAEFAFPLLKKYGFKATVFVVTGCIGATNRWDAKFETTQEPLMTAEEIRLWADDNIEIGSHSVSHPDLRACSDETVLLELKNSRDSLEQLIGRPVTSFAYPYGYWNERVAKVANAIYLATATSDCGINSSPQSLARLRRAMIIPRYNFGQIFWATHLGFNPWMMLQIQFQLRSERIGQLLASVPPPKPSIPPEMLLLNCFRLRSPSLPHKPGSKTHM